MVLCDMVIQSTDKTVSAVRLVDTINLPQDYQHSAGDAIQFDTPKLFISLKKGDAVGEFALEILSCDPSGKKTSVGMAEHVDLGNEPQSGRVLVQPVRVVWNGEGVYWIELLANN